MITVKIDEFTLLELLKEELERWDMPCYCEDLYVKMYKKDLELGRFNGTRFETYDIVCADLRDTYVIDEDNADFEKVLELFNRYGIDEYNEEFCKSIEAVDNEEVPTWFLIRR